MTDYLRALITLLSLAAFIGIVWWTYWLGGKERFDQAARLPLDDERDDKTDGKVNRK